MLDLFSIRFSPNSAILKAGSSKIVEVVENLFMKHLTKNLTNIDNLGVRLKEIKA